MGAYLRKPVTEKNSDSGEYEYCGRKIIYASTSMQGWRISMEDAHSVVPHFDQDSSLFAVYDGHGGKEVAVYCANKMGDLIKSMEAYKNGDMSQALKDAFVSCDKQLLLPEVAKELKKIANDNNKEEDNDSSSEDIEELITEANLPLQMIMERYGKDKDSSEEEKEAETGSSVEKGGVKNVLQMLVNSLDYADSDNSDSDVDPSLELDESEDSSDEENISSAQDNPVSVSEDVTETISIATLLQKQTEMSSVKSLDETTPTVASPEPANSPSDNKPSNSNLPQVESEQIEETKAINETEKPKRLKDLLTAGVEDKYNVDRSLVEARDDDIIETGCKRPHPEEEDILLSPQTFCKRRETSEEGYESGTTAVVCLLHKEKLFVANAGDSRCVLSSNGKAVELSFDHKPTDKLELERIVKAGGRVGSDGRVNRGLNLSRAIGDHFYKQVESLPLVDQMISPLPDIETAVLDDDSEFLLLACDGIWNCKSSQEVVDYVHTQLTKEREEDLSQQGLIAICEDLCDECMAKNNDNDGTGCDNMTCILVLLKSLT